MCGGVGVWRCGCVRCRCVGVGVRCGCEEFVEGGMCACGCVEFVEGPAGVCMGDRGVCVRSVLV